MRHILALSAVVLLLGLGVAQAGSGAFLGVVPEPIDEETAEELGYKGRGVYVASVVEGTAAEKAGMEDGDVIVEIDGDKLVGPGHLRDVLGLHSPGDRVKIKVWREGKTHTLTAELGEHEDVAEKIKQKMKKIVVCKEPKAWLGVKLQGLTDQLSAYFGVDKGVLVAEVFDDSPASKAGLKAGDVVTQLDGEQVECPSSLSKAVGKKEPGDKVSVTLIRKGEKLTKQVELIEPPEEYRKKRCMMYAYGIPGMESLGQLEHLGKLKELEDLRDIEIEIPEIEVEGDLQELREDMEELKEELQELKKELKEKK